MSDWIIFEPFGVEAEKKRALQYTCNYHYPRNDKTVPERGNGTTP